MNKGNIRRIQARIDRGLAALKIEEKPIGYRLCLNGSTHEHMFSCPDGRGGFLDKAARAEFGDGIRVSLVKCPDGIPNWTPKPKNDKSKSKIDANLVKNAVESVDVSDIGDEE